MKFENSNGHTKEWSDLNHNAEHRKVLPGRMSYITVQENAIKWWVTVNGLNHHEVCSFISMQHPFITLRVLIVNHNILQTFSRKQGWGPGGPS